MGLFSSKPKFIDLTAEGPVFQIEKNWFECDISSRGPFDGSILKNTAYTAKIVEKMNDNLEYLISEIKHLQEENQVLKEENQVLKKEICCLKG